MKLLIRLVLLVLVLAIAAVVGVVFYANGIAKKAIETGATRALGVTTTLDSARLGLLKGEFAMSGLQVANPSGFDQPHFLQLNDGSTAVSYASLGQSEIELPYLTLSGLDLVLLRSGGKSNYQIILDNLKRLESGQSAGPSEGTTQFVIKKVLVQDIKVHVDLLPLGGSLTRIDVPIDKIELTDVGSGTSGGVAMAELYDVLIKAVLQAVLEKGGDRIPSEIFGELQGGLAQLQSLREQGITSLTGVQSTITGVGEQVGKVQEDLQKTLGEGKAAGEDLKNKADEAVKGLGDLFGGKKDKK